MAYVVSREELLDQLKDQLGFLIRSADAFDQGHEGEAKRMATVLRVLVHDTRRSRSLLEQLGLKARLRWIDTAQRIFPANLAPTNGLALLRMQAGPDGMKASYEAPLGNRPPMMQRPPIAFRRWWTTDVIKDGRGSLFSRERLIKTVANKEGGAHVDTTLEDDYAALSRENSFGWVAGESVDGKAVPAANGGAPTGNPALVSVRQVAFEVIETLGPQVPWLLAKDEQAEFGIERAMIDRDALCPCGRGVTAGKCCLADPARALALGDHFRARNADELSLDAYQVASEGGNADGSHNLGVVLTELGNFEGAEAAFELGAQQGNGNSASNLGALHVDRDQIEEAKTAWERGVALKSGQAAANLGSKLVITDRKRAKQLFLDGAKWGSAESAFLAATLCREDGEMKEALRLLGKARKSGHGQATLAHGAMLKEAGMPKSAKVAFEAAAQSDDQQIASQANAALAELS